jgi:protein phosphatase
MPQASYAILEGRYASPQADTFAVHVIRVPYDIERAIQQAAAEDMPELDAYAKELRTAQHRGSVAGKQAS